jgi:hypothetical protein
MEKSGKLKMKWKIFSFSNEHGNSGLSQRICGRKFDLARNVLLFLCDLREYEKLLWTRHDDLETTGFKNAS